MRLERVTGELVEVDIDPAREFRRDLSESRLAQAALRSYAENERESGSGIPDDETYASLSQKLDGLPLDIIKPTRLCLSLGEASMLRQAALRAVNRSSLRLQEMKANGSQLTSGFGVYSDELTRLNTYSTIVDQLPPQITVSPDDLSKAA